MTSANLNHETTMTDAEFQINPLNKRGQFTGKKFNYWTIIETRGMRSKCECVCGKVGIRFTQSIVRGNSKSCGCKTGEIISASKIIHGGCKRSGETREFRSWRMMRARCESPKHKYYYNYGGRGIKICERWLKFENFLADMGPRPEGTSIDRINGNGDYEPENCVWSTRRIQNSHTRNSIHATIDGKTQCVAHWCQELGKYDKKVYAKIKQGLTPENAILTS